MQLGNKFGIVWACYTMPLRTAAANSVSMLPPNLRTAAMQPVTASHPREWSAPGAHAGTPHQPVRRGSKRQRQP